MVGPGEFGGMAVLDAVTRGEWYRVQRVAYDVPGVMDDLGEADVVHVVEEGGGVGVVVVVKVKVKVWKEDAVVGVDGEGGDKVCDEVPLMVNLPSVWSLKFRCSMAGVLSSLWWCIGLNPCG